MKKKSSNKLFATVIFLLISIGLVFGAWHIWNAEQKNLYNAKVLNLKKNLLVDNQEELTGIAPDFTLPDINGKDFSLSDIAKDKAVILSFWVSWCDDCSPDLETFQSLYKKYNSKIELLAVNALEDNIAVKDFVGNIKVDFPILLDEDGEVMNAYGLGFANTHVLINKNKQIVRIVFGNLTEDHFRELELR